MTIIEAINIIDAMKPNNYTQGDKIAWLSKLDGVIVDEIINTHEDSELVDFDGYNEDTALDTALIVPDAYGDIYFAWLESRIDYANGEYAKYNNSITEYNAAYSAYANWYNRNHKPLYKSFKYF